MGTDTSDLTRFRRQINWRIVRAVGLAMVSALCLVVIFYLLTEVRSKLSELSSSPSDNVQWTLSQLEVEYLEFSGALDHVTSRLAEIRANGPGQRPPPPGPWPPNGPPPGPMPPQGPPAVAPPQGLQGVIPSQASPGIAPPMPDAPQGPAGTDNSQAQAGQAAPQSPPAPGAPGGPVAQGSAVGPLSPSVLPTAEQVAPAAAPTGSPPEGPMDESTSPPLVPRGQQDGAGPAQSGTEAPQTEERSQPQAGPQALAGPNAQSSPRGNVLPGTENTDQPGSQPNQREDAQPNFQTEAQTGARPDAETGATAGTSPQPTARVDYPHPPSYPAAHPADYALATALKEMKRRYDILYSRVDTLMNSPLYTPALDSPRMDGAFRRAAQEIYDWARIIDLPDPALIATVESLGGRVESTRREIRSIMSIGNQALVSQSDAARRDVANVLYRLALVSAVLLLALTSLVVISLRLAVLSGRRASEVSATTARLATIVETSQDAIAVLTPRGVVESLNDAGRQMFGLEGDGAIGERIGALLRSPGQDGARPVSGKELTDACAEGRKRGYRLTGRHSDGRTFPVELSMDMARRDDRAVLVCMIRDISHQAETEAALVESRDQARAGERAKARFLGVISHEMRTPLNGILGTIELMDDSDEGSRSALLPVLRNSAQVLLGLVNDVLDLTQIEGGGTQLTAAPFDLDQLLSEIIDSEVPRAQARDNQLMRTPGAPTLGWVNGDRARLRQILLNLVSNAVKFTREGEITLDAARVGREQVEFQVSDTGIGMSPTDVTRIFEDFVRLDSALREQVQGTGLGLGIARQLARAMGGDIGVESEEGQGSLFWVRLPLPMAEAASDPAPAEETETGALPALDILLVEDNATNRLVARKMLERDGHRVTEAHDGAAGLQAARERAYDVILMDVSMPVMDGTTATRHIRTGDGPCRSTRIVALTAHIGEGVAQELHAHGLDEVLSKPLRWRDLRRVLRASPQPTPLNRRVLEELQAATGTAKARDLVRCFIAEGERLRADWQARPPRPAGPVEASSLPDLDTLAEGLHRFAGSSATFGAMRLLSQLHRAEAAARAGDREGCDAAIAAAEALWPPTREALEAWVEAAAADTPRPGGLRRALP